MKLKSKKDLRHRTKVIVISTIAYGMIFIITDIIHYFYSLNAEKEFLESGILPIIYIPFEIFDVKVYNIVIHLILIAAGITFLQKKSISWYLYNLFFIGWILKFPSLFIWDTYFRVNWIETTGLSYYFSIAGLIYFNKNKVKRLINHTKINKLLLLVIYTFCIFLILSIISYNNSETPRDTLQHNLNKAIVKNKYSKFKNHFQNIMDTVSVNWDNIYGLSIVIINEKNKPIYKEELVAGESDLLCFPYKYDEKGNLLQEFVLEPFYNAIIYKYDSIDRLVTKKLCSNFDQVTFLSSYDTITNEDNCIIFYRYQYLDNNIIETGYRSENDPFLKYELHRNEKGQIISRSVIQGYSDEGNTYNFYNDFGNIERIDEYGASEQLRTRKYFYYQNNKLIKSEEYYYGVNNLSDKLLNLIKLKFYTSKYITYYFNDNEII